MHKWISIQYISVQYQDLYFQCYMSLSFLILLSYKEKFEYTEGVIRGGEPKKVRDYCAICWYWWNCWPSLFKLSFHSYLLWNNMRYVTGEYIQIYPRTCNVHTTTLYCQEQFWRYQRGNQKPQITKGQTIKCPNEQDMIYKSYTEN